MLRALSEAPLEALPRLGAQMQADEEVCRFRRRVCGLLYPSHAPTAHAHEPRCFSAFETSSSPGHALFFSPARAHMLPDIGNSYELANRQVLTCKAWFYFF